MKKTRIVCAFITALGFGASACGGGDSAEDTELQEALAAAWIAEDEFPEAIDIECAAKGLVDGVGGAEGAAEYGVTAANVGDNGFEENPLNEDHARAAAKNMLACDSFKKELLAEIADAVDDEQATCVAEGIKDEHLEALLASTFMGDAGSAIEEEFENDFEKDLFATFESCGIS